MIHRDHAALPPSAPPVPQCLYSNGGYTYLDVRTTLENEEVGKVRGSASPGGTQGTWGAGGAGGGGLPPSLRRVTAGSRGCGHGQLPLAATRWYRRMIPCVLTTEWQLSGTCPGVRSKAEQHLPTHPPPPPAGACLTAAPPTLLPCFCRQVKDSVNVPFMNAKRGEPCAPQAMHGHDGSGPGVRASFGPGAGSRHGGPHRNTPRAHHARLTCAVLQSLAQCSIRRPGPRTLSSRRTPTL